ncbi:methyltransferase [Fluviicola sp.]|uniref:tRNA1(Val) (adenine(37)-N6)-methyltransferase n=1 Tax=Fluviicola sp. TaxID=1917219 RepID=UPI002638D787|nr:methyltransferase [Fluviicola sp.]
MSVFKFKHFQIQQKHAALKVGTDSMILGSLCQWNSPKRLLDIGTGTGVLALMCAQRFLFEEIIGLEISEEAFIDAMENAESSPFQSRISVFNQALQDYQSESPFDAIISNPPFFENSFKNADSQKTLARHTDSLTFEELLNSIANLLSSDGKAWLIIPFDAFDSLIRLAERNNLFPADLITIFGKPNKSARVVLSLQKKQVDAKKSSLCIRDEHGKYTPEYKVLTRDFHDRVLD